MQAEAGAAGQGWALVDAAVDLQVVPLVEEWLLDNEDLLALAANIAQRSPPVDIDTLQ